MTIPMGKGRYLLALAMLAGVGMAFWWGVNRLRVNNDITAALPRDDKVVAAAEEILRHHPVLDNIFVQISASGGNENKEALVKAADLASAMLSESGLVKVVSSGGAAESYVILIDTVTENLPLLLSEKDLRDKVGDLIQPGRVESIVEDGFRKLLDLGSIGQAQYVAKDPLGLRNLFLSRLSSGLPFRDVTLEQGYIMSQDGRHLLLIARPTRPSQDASFGRPLTEVMERISAGLKELSAPQEKSFSMTYVGAFRASLDNEEIIRHDTSRALTLVMLSLIPLVLLSFQEAMAWPAISRSRHGWNHAGCLCLCLHRRGHFQCGYGLWRCPHRHCRGSWISLCHSSGPTRRNRGSKRLQGCLGGRLLASSFCSGCSPVPHSHQNSAVCSSGPLFSSRRGTSRRSLHTSFSLFFCPDSRLQRERSHYLWSVSWIGS